jgi:hypothetical protein
MRSTTQPTLKGPSKGLQRAFDQAVEVIRTRYVRGDLHSFCNGRPRFGFLSDGMTFLWLDEEGGCTDRPGFPAQLATLEAALGTKPATQSHLR